MFCGIGIHFDNKNDFMNGLMMSFNCRRNRRFVPTRTAKPKIFLTCICGGSYEYEFHRRMCDKCLSKARTLLSSRKTDELSDQLVMVITCQDTEQSHDGYCSGHGEIQTSVNTVYGMFRVMKGIGYDGKTGKVTWVDPKIEKLYDEAIEMANPHNNHRCSCISHDRKRTNAIIIECCVDDVGFGNFSDVFPVEDKFDKIAT